jgi:UDP-N-acetylmuramyl pentapeptide synthase
MIHTLKKKLYFVIANYFRFFARIVLERWQPQVIVVTGSNGKTTLLHLIESQLKDQAIYSHKANSAFGVPFHILGLERKTLAKTEWVGLFIKAPWLAFRKVPEQDIYVVEVDCDRPNEGKFLGELLRPEITLWVSSDLTHSMNFDAQVNDKTFDSLELAIAHEFGWLVQTTQKLVVLKDDKHMIDQLNRTQARSKTISLDQLESYKLTKTKSVFVTKKGNKYTLPEIMPKISFIQIGMTHMLMKLLKKGFDPDFKDYKQPPGRSSILKAKNGATLFDSSYNANLASVEAALKTFATYPGKIKWAVIGDMIELGQNEKQEHQKLADLIAREKFDHIILMGPRVKKYTKPKLRKLIGNKTQLVAFEDPKPVLDYLEQELTGKEVVFFKGARYLEGVIKNLLADPKDAEKLCRQEEYYQQVRKNWHVG